MQATYEVDPVRTPPLGGHVSLLFSWANSEVRAFAVRENQAFVVGRAEPADWILDDRSLSRTHARLSLRGGVVTLEDLGSTNGCFSNGQRIQTVELAEGEVVLLGRVELRLCSQASLQDQMDTLSHAAFLRCLSDELVRVRRFGRAVSVVAIKHSEDTALLERLTHGARPLDRICVYAPRVTLVLLPEQDGEAARRWLDGIEWPGRSSVRAGVATFPVLPASAEGLISAALNAGYKAPAGQWIEAERSKPAPDSPVVIASPCMQRLYDLVDRAARTSLPALIQGETGSGKELVARALHDKGPRAKGLFKALNCATIPAGLLESVLFGHERGAFTGAEKQVQGVFEQAQGGTVFLDEVGELAMPAQAALLRVLEMRCLIRVGGTREIGIDARVIAATHRDLGAMVQAGTFRQDLMFRLDALTLRVPPLRERREEILPLAEKFLERARQDWGSLAMHLSPDAADALVTYRWPGNVRQLKNVMERAAVVCAGESIALEDLPEHIWMDSDESLPVSTIPVADGGFRALPDRIREFEISILREALAKAAGNQAQAARMLGVPRRTLANKAHAYGLIG